MTNDYLKMQVETMLFKCDKCGTMTTQKNNPIAVTGYETYCNKCKQFKYEYAHGYVTMYGP